MFALNVLINLAKIMLIFNGLNGNTIGISEASFTTISSNIANSNITRSSSSSSSSSISSISSSEVALEGLSSLDNLNIRHERSKQRRHSSNTNTNTEKEQSHGSRNLYEATSDVQQQLHAQHQIQNDFKTNNVDATAQRQLFNEFPKSFSLTNDHMSEGSSSIEQSNANFKHINGQVSLTATDVIKNDTSLANKSPTMATLHRLTPSGPMTTTSLNTVTHKIRKLHKKKIVESLRQLNIDKFNTNGGHHRSLLEAEQLQHQQQATHMARATAIDITTTSYTFHTPTSSPSMENGRQENVRKFQQPEEQQQYQQWQWLLHTTTVAPEMQTTERATNKDKVDVVAVATNDVDTNESVNDSDLPDMLAVDDETDVDIDDDDTDTDEPSDDNDDLTDVLYPNDENLLADEGVDANSDNDELLVTTLNPLLDDKYIEKHFKNYSSQFIKEIDNNVDDMEDNETEDLHNQQQQQVQDFPMKNSLHNLTVIMDVFNSTYETPNTTLPFVTYATELANEFHSYEPSLAASTSQHNIHLQSSFSDKEDEINLNDPSDLTQDDAEDTGYGDKSHANGFPLTDNDADAETDADAEVTLEIGGGGEDDETNHFLEGVVDAANSEEIYDWDEISRSNRRDLMHGRDVVTKFLQIVETQHSLGSNCEAGTSLNLGEGVVDRYAQDRFRVEAEVAVNRANMLTRIFKMTSSAAQADVNLLHASVLSMVEFDDDIFAAGNCFDWNEHPSQPGLFCPFAYRLPPPNLGAILAKDLAMEYHYLGNTSEWFFQARKNAEKVIARNEQYLKAFHLYSNKTDERIEDDTLAVKYEDGRWSKPYYDCGGGNIWMLTYTVPFFGYENTTYHFKGTSGIDIDLRRVDIDQCPQRHIPGSTKPLNIFAGTDKCKQRTTMCEAIQGLGFRRGSYKCVCRKGYYFPDTTSQHKYFNGSLLEEEYEKLMLGKNSTYNIVNEYECLPCAEGCDYCEDGSPCIAALNWPMRTSILALACIVIGLLPPAAWFTFRYQQVKVVRAASPALLRVIALGAFFIYCTNIVMYPNPNLYTCTARIWLREIGFSLTYGALMLKTWRISVIFRVRSAKAVKITDAALLKRLGCICGCIGTCLLVRTLVSPPDVVVGRTADDLKAFLCKTDWWDYTFTSMEVVFLAWGVRLCIMVRKAPSEFNESRFISMAIYNEFLLTCFLNVSMLFLQSPANPDLLYIIFFCHTQLTITLLLALIFGSKVYIVLRSGKSHQENIGMGAKSSGAKFNFRPQVRTFANPSSVTTSTVPVAVTTSAENKLSDQEALEEIRQLSVQLQRIQEMAPPKGVAVMTISSLLDGLKTPGSMVMVAAAATAGGQSALGGGNQLTVRSQKPEALPLLSLNSEMQKYQQLQTTQKTSVTTTTTTNNNVAAMKTMPAITMPSTQVTITASTPTQAVASKLIAAKEQQEKAVNTDIIGNYIGNEEHSKQQQQQQQHIICQSCYEKCQDQTQYQQLPLATAMAMTKPASSPSAAHSPAKLNKCQMLGSPQQEGSLSFKHIKLDCMCSQSDDLDQLTEQGHPHQHQHQASTRRVTKRTAATNTPPCTARKRTEYNGDKKAQSTISLPSGASTSELASKTMATSTTKPISHVSQQKTKFQKQEQQQQQQICDNCKNKFKRKTSLEGSGGPREKLTRKSQQQHRKLSRLSSKCNQLLEDIEKSKSKPMATTTTTATIALNRAALTSTYAGSSKSRLKDCDEDIQYSTDDIIFYTTTDSSDDDDDDDDDDEDISDEDDNSNDDSDKSDYETELAKVLKDDDLSSSLSQSKSETRVPLKLKPQTATIELKCISLSLGNITTTSSVTLTTATTTTITATTATSSATPSTSQPSEALRNKNALFEPNAIELRASSPLAMTAGSSTSQPLTQLGQSQPPASSNGANSSGSGTGNGKAKRPDKLVLNLNDRSKFTKEVSV